MNAKPHELSFALVSAERYALGSAEPAPHETVSLHQNILL